ncbi:MAG: Flp pilus assembly complex ATPase component TadA [Planctomycetaceae bacterium]|jgi:type IV pilus assembly protein PilB|nr:Flp pilus assembly complex ATPase component TadA [Planctomycetaceae bacterium]
MARSKKKLGEILVGWGVVTQDQVEAAAGKAKTSGKKLGDALMEAGVPEEQIAKALANQFGLEYVDLSSNGVAAQVNMKLIPEELVKKHLILPMAKNGRTLQLIVHDPGNLELFDTLRFRLSTDLELRLSSRSQIRKFIENASAKTTKLVDPNQSLVSESIDKSVDKSVDKSMDKSIDITGEDAPIVRLVQRILAEAVKMRASDIHIEPMADRVRLRYRIDGVCMERDNLPKRMQNSVLSRVKLMAGMNIAEKRVPQDGRIKITVDETTIDFRVSACPCYHGESVVLRILRPDSVKIGLVNLGFEEDSLAVFNKIIRKPNGIFLVTGPTGSGKTTTLYSALDVLNRPDKKIITAEDPIEYNFRGINQCQVRDKIGLTFQVILKTMLRQAPNIILVGEIRDREVAEIAIQAALTGHLVFSTLHTNDAPGAITRLIDMGVKPFLVASAIQAIMAQRLVRTLCGQCKQINPEPDEKYCSLINVSKEEAAGRVYMPVGCSNCNSVGYRGRKGIYEMMLMNAEIRELAFKQEPLVKIRQAAIANGMRTLMEDGKLKVLKGITTPDEIARVAQVEGLS